MRSTLCAPAVLVVAAMLLVADGGSVLLHQRSGRFLITVFGTARVGITDISVLLQNAEDRSPVLDAEVDVVIGNSGVRATHEQATNKLLYAVPVRLTHSGESHLEVTVTSHGESAVIDGNVEVAPEAPPLIAYWPYFALVPAVTFLFVLNQWLKRKRSVRGLEAPPSRHSGH